MLGDMDNLPNWQLLSQTDSPAILLPTQITLNTLHKIKEAV